MGITTKLADVILGLLCGDDGSLIPLSEGGGALRVYGLASLTIRDLIVVLWVFAMEFTSEMNSEIFALDGTETERRSSWLLSGPMF